MPILNFCCCCCRLQTGGVVLGYIESFISLVSLIAAIVLVAKADTVVESLNSMMRQAIEQNPHIRLQQGQNIFIDPKAFKIEFSILIVVTAISLLVAIALIIGATKRNHKLLLPYLGYKVVYLLYLVYVFIALLLGGGSASVAIETVCYFGFCVYLWVCVFSLYQELREQSNSPRDAYVMQQQPYNPQVYKPPTVPNY